jgi:signal transduction histidine kinase
MSKDRMKRNALLIICFALIYSLTNGQSGSKVDSLEQVLATVKTDTARISVQNKLAKEYLMQNDSVRAFKYVYSSQALAKNNPSLYHKAQTDQILGYIHTILMHEDSSLYYNNKVVSQLQDQTSDAYIRLTVYATNNIAAIYATNGNIKKAAELLIANLPRLEKIQDHHAYKVTILNISASFNNLDEHQKAYPYMRQSIDLVENNNSTPEEKVGSYLNGAFVMYKMDSIDRMGGYLIKLKENLDKQGHATPFTGRYYAYKALYYAKTHQVKEAEAMLANAVKELKTFGIRPSYYDVNIARQDVALARNDYRGAREAAIALYNLALEDRYNETILGSAKEIADYSEHLGDYKTAFEYQKKYISFEDSVKYQQTVREVHDLETKYQTSEKEKKIASLQVEKQQALLKNKDQQLLNWLLSIGAGVLLLITVFLVYFYRNSKKQAQQQLREIEQQQALRLTQAMLEGEERERTRMARDLHDGLGGTLSGIKLKLSSRHKADTQLVDEAVLQLEDSIGELRRIARNMMPESLMKSGLETALRDLCASMASQNREVEFQVNGISKDLTLTSQVNIYRIIQELLANAVRHSNATKVIVQCIQENNNFLITVEDNGKGFDTNTAQQQQGIGLSNIYNRVNYLKGRVDISSSTGEGTFVNIELYV